MKRYSIIVAISLACIFSACKKDEDNTVAPPASSGNMIVYSDLSADPSTNFGRFQYFRLKDSAIVAFSDSNSTQWDIAFSTTTIRTNSGTSGPGRGGALVLKSTSFDDVTAAPTSGYNIDTSSTMPAIKTGSGNGWYNYNFSTNVISPIPGNILVIRTADGKYAKMEILSYYKNAPAAPDTSSTPRYYTFRYFYQADGSNKLE